MLSSRGYLALLTGIAMLTIAAAWVYVTHWQMSFMGSGFAIWSAKQNLLRSCDIGDVLIVGDSRAEAAIMPSGLSVKAANISFAGTTPIETYRFATRALECPRPPKVAIYVHGMPNFTGVESALWEVASRNGFIGFHELREISADADKLNDSSVWESTTRDGLRGIVRDAVYSSGFPTTYFSSLVAGEFFRRKAQNVEVLGDVSRDRGFLSYENVHVPLDAREAAMKSFAPKPIVVWYFERTLQRLSQAGVKVFIVTTPMPGSFVAAIAPEPRDEFNRFMRREASAYRGANVVGNLFTAWPEDYFFDPHHLNPKGAALFTHQLDQCLKAWLAEPEQPPPACDFAIRP